MEYSHLLIHKHTLWIIKYNQKYIISCD